MKNDDRFTRLVKELRRDPRLKRAIDKRPIRNKGGANVQGAADLVFLLLTIASRFVKKKRARVLDELKDSIHLLVQVSLLLKENIFDRPEVKEFFRHRPKQVYLLAKEGVAMVLPKTKELYPKRATRSA